MKVGIVGLGLIGGSMAKAVKKRTEHKVYGFDINEDVIKRAVSYGDIDEELTNENIGDCRLLLIALYPKAAVDFVKERLAAIPDGITIVDLCGVKRAVMEPMAEALKGRNIRYIGGHPMAGTEKSGYDNATGELFENASMILVESGFEKEEGAEAFYKGDSCKKELKPEGGREASKCEKERKKQAGEDWEIEDFFLELGFLSITKTTKEEHDRIIAFTSQLAHVVSSAYIKSPTALMHFGFSAGSYRDLTRVAKLNEVMWTELFLDNAEYLSEEIEGIIERLREYDEAIRAGDRERLKELLKKGRELKEGIDRV